MGLRDPASLETLLGPIEEPFEAFGQQKSDKSAGWFSQAGEFSVPSLPQRVVQSSPLSSEFEVIDEGAQRETHKRISTELQSNVTDFS